MRELAFLNQGLKITLEWKENSKTSTTKFQSKGGLGEYVDYLANGRQKLHNGIRLKGKDVAGCEVDLKLTERQGHGIWLTETADLSDYDGVVAGMRLATGLWLKARP